jgi:pimeloyl-ACP methyl ester carboxylesterase
VCDAGVPAWVVHAEKGDGGLTDGERGTLEACPHVHLVTIPGHVFFLPNEVPEQIAAIIREAAEPN